MLPSAVGIFCLLYGHIASGYPSNLRRIPWLPGILQHVYLIDSVLPVETGFKNYVLTVCTEAHVL